MFGAQLAVLLDDALSHKLPVEHIQSIHERIKLLQESSPPEGGALRDTLAAVALLFDVEGDAYDELNAPSDDTLERVRRLIVIRQSERKARA